MMKPTLVILAAGMGSRYGGMKQIDSFGPNGETIIDYSIYDAIKAGFGKICFVIKEEFSESFQKIFEPKLKGKIETSYVFQDFNLKKYGIEKNVARSKPWGTGHAVLAAKSEVAEPFCVINADDFYGYDSFAKMFDFLTTDVNDRSLSLIGYHIEKTLSDYGSVSRGVCQVDQNGYMVDINERTNVYFKNDNSNKKVVFKEDDIEHELPKDTLVSMNFWGFTPSIFQTLEDLFKKFVEDNYQNEKAEFFIPLVADYLIKEGKAIFKVIPTSSQWFGVTYQEDKPLVQASINDLIQQGNYPKKLWD